MTTVESMVAESLDEAMVTHGITARFRRIRKNRAERAQSANARRVTFVLHPHPRAHDLFGVYMFREEGHRRGLVVGEMEIICDRTTAPAETNPWRLVQVGIIPLCVGDGPWSKVARDTDTASMTRNTARWLGIEKESGWSRLVDWVHATHLPPGPGDWRQSLGMLRTMSLAQMDDPMAVYLQFETMLDAIRAELEEEAVAAADLDKFVVSEVSHQGRMLKMGLGVSDSGMIARMARKVLKTDVLVRLDSTGHALVSAGNGVSLRQAVANLRAAEYQTADLEPPLTLSQVGIVDSADKWVYKLNQPGKMEAIINGGWTAPDIAGTALDLERVGFEVFAGLQGE